jgi:hypothetical protein
MYVLCVCMCLLCVLVCACVCARAHTHTYTYTLLLFVSLFLFILSVTSFVSISLCMRIRYGVILSTHTNTQGRGYICGHYFQGARPHPTSYVHEQTEELVHNRVKRLAGQANGQRHAQYLLDLWLQGLRKQLANHLRHALWRKPSTILRESTMTLANFS